VPNNDGAMRLQRAYISRLLFLLVMLPAVAPFTPRAFADSPAAADNKLILRSGWKLQSSCQAKEDGRRISASGFRTAGWHEVTVPSTVLAALVADKTFPDPYFGENLRSIPGADYPLGQNFAVLAMPKDSPFRCSWWYRIEFQLPGDYAGRRVWLDFGGINNRANIWINQHRIASAQNVVGAYRTYEFDVTAMLRKNQRNVLAVETFAQAENDLGINWVDWNPAPPDKNLGLWRDVYLRASGPVAMRYPQVVTHFSAEGFDRADLTVETELRNATEKVVGGVLKGQIGPLRFQRNVTLGPGETRTVRFAPADFSQLRIAHPQVWWPAQMGAPNLQELSLQFVVGAEVSDSATTRFGIREITSEVDARGHRVFRVNGRRILIRGGGWAPDMLLRESSERLETEFRYLRDLNLNAIRLEGKMESEEFFDLADEKGVLVIAGWSCCDFWEQWPKWKPRDLEVARESLRSQILRMRSHPSLLAWLNGSDNPPPATVEREYLKVLEELDWPNPYLSSASGSATTVTGPSGVKMTGPYDYQPPGYWLIADGKYGGAHGFITETSAGPSVPPIGSLKKMLGAVEIDNAAWNYHAGLLGFKSLSHVEEAMKAIYGAPAGTQDYLRKAQAMAYDSERAMFEAYSRNKYESTGIIQWMLNNAWPSLIWHLYDYYLQPAGGYFGAKKACEPVHVQYSYDDRGIDVVNSRYEDAGGLTVSAEVYDISLHERFSKKVRLAVGADAVARAFALPDGAFTPASPVYFTRLRIENDSGETISRNFYWLSAKGTVYDWKKTTYRYTPAVSYEDFSELQSLPKAQGLGASAEIAENQEGPVVRVLLRNPSSRLAFQLHAAILGRDDQGEILPVLWKDNYLELMPGESREITAQFLTPDALKGGADLQVSGWNIDPLTVPLTAGGSGGIH
jgi:exo-1,4-beta-D-glucosaminidase